MIFVTNGNDVEPLIQISNFEMNQEVRGEFQISFLSHKTDKNPAHRILLEESIITVGEFEFRVKQLKENRIGKQVIAVNTFYDLIDKRQNEIYGGTRTMNEFLNFIFKDTGWRTSTDFNDSAFIENFGENNVIALVEQLCDKHGCEYRIMPNNQVHFSKQIGGDYDAQYRYGHNVVALSKNVDTTRLKTYIEGYGKIDDEQGGQLYVSYTSPHAAKYGIREADPVHDERYTIPNELLDRIKSEIIDYPEVTFELDSVELLDKELGERVWLIYEPLDMEFQTRILSQTKQIVNGILRTTKVVLGNTIPRTISDIFVEQKIEIDENKEIFRSRIEQTNDRITMEVENVGKSLAELEIKADNIKIEVTNKLTEEIGKVNVRADNIELSVKKAEDEIAKVDIKANEIKSTVSAQGDALAKQQAELAKQQGELDDQGRKLYDSGVRLTQAETTISQHSTSINLKLDATDFTGRNIVSEINLGTGGVMIRGENINLVGAVRVLSDITGDMGNIYAGNISLTNDVRVGNNIYLQGSGGKGLHFFSGNQITSTSDVMTISAPYVRIDTNATIGGFNTTTYLGGTVDFSRADNIIGVAKANSRGIGISTDGSTLFVQVNGTRVGSVKLAP